MVVSKCKNVKSITFVDDFSLCSKTFFFHVRKVAIIETPDFLAIKGESINVNAFYFIGYFKGLPIFI